MLGYAPGHAATVSPHYSPPSQRQQLRKMEVFMLPQHPTPCRRSGAQVDIVPLC